MIRRAPPKPARRKPPVGLVVQWQGPFENYARKWISKHHWRVAATLGDREDALQECAMIFVRCLNHYRHRVDNPAWFMALYKIALVNDWNTLAARDGKARALAMPDPDTVITHNDGPLLATLRGASAELRTVLGLIAAAPHEVLEVIFAKGDDAHVNARLKRWGRISALDVNLVGELRELLTN